MTRKGEKKKKDIRKSSYRKKCHINLPQAVAALLLPRGGNRERVRRRESVVGREL